MAVQPLSDSSFLFSPINNAHAIVEVVFFVQFSQNFEPFVMERLLAIDEESVIKQALPHKQLLRKFVAQIEQHQEDITGHVDFSDGPAGILLQSFKRDGSTHDWMIRITENVIAVHCLDYSTWKNIWAQAATYLTAVLKRLEDASMTEATVGLKYLDRFLYKGADQDYNAAGLFQRNTELLFPYAFVSTPAWHCHTGWFAEGPWGPCLHQLNVEAGYGSLAGQRTHITTIDHTTTVQSPGEAATILDVSFLHEVMAFLHQSNKQLLAKLLTPQMARRINLNVAQG